MLYQYFIYDSAMFNCEFDFEPIIDYSYIYENKEQCERNAIERCEDLDETYETNGRFQYEIFEQEIIDKEIK